MKKIFACVLMVLVALSVAYADLKVFPDSTAAETYTTRPTTDNPANPDFSVQVFEDATGASATRSISQAAPKDAIPFREVATVAAADIPAGYIKVAYDPVNSLIEFYLIDATGTARIATISVSDL